MASATAELLNPLQVLPITEILTLSINLAVAFAWLLKVRSPAVTSAVF